MELLQRVELLMQAEQDPRIQAVLMEMCRRDIVYWFNTFVYTFDPRAAEGTDPDMCFNLYPYQEWCIKEWLDNVEKQESFCIEKSRDVGASWMLMMIFLYCWLFRPGYHFHCGSHKESEVCTASVDPATTLFGKFRFALYRLPRWMRPTPDRMHDKKLHIENQVNGNILTGESSNPRFGRGARKRAILLDELSYWDCAEEAWNACTATTNCRIALSTPCGESNIYYRIMHDIRNDLRLYEDFQAQAAGS